MLADLTILIVEDEMLVALDLAVALEEHGATVVGPLATVADGLGAAEGIAIDAAILDANLLDRDITQLALRLIERGIPFVIHTGTGLPDALAAVYADLPTVMKPAAPVTVLRALEAVMTQHSGTLMRLNLPPQA